MKLINNILHVQFVLTGILFSSFTFALTPTPSLVATFTTTVDAGTCNAEVQDSTGASTSDINFGDVYKSNLADDTMIKDFKISFSGCSGAHTADITTSITGSCSGSNFPNSTGTSTNAEVEIWEGEPGEGSQFSCVNRSTTSHSLSISSDSGNMSMSARMVIASGKTIDNVTAGSFIAPVTFLVTYQ